MEDLLLMAIVLAAIGFAIWLYIQFLAHIALPVAAVVAVVGAALGAGAALHAFATSMWYRVRNRGADAARPGGDEPAFRSYMVGPVLRDLGASLSFAFAELIVWVQTPLALARLLVDGKRHVWVISWPLALAVACGSATGAVGGFAILVVAALLSSLVILPLVAVALLAGKGLQAVERFQQRLRRAHYRCSTCHAAFEHPVYRCPGCGGEHHDLLPGTYGIFRRRCACDQVLLPTLRGNGRAEVPAFCPELHPLPRCVGRLEDVHIPIAGAAHSGKTTLLAAAFAELAGLAQDELVRVELQGTDGEAFARVVDDLGTGKLPGKTVSQQQPALLARVGVAGGRRQRERFLFAYDVAGELYGDADRVRASQSLNAIRGAVLVVDPESLASVRLRQGTAAGAVQLESPSAVYARLVNVLKERGADLKKIPFAVVLTKVDALEDPDLHTGSPSGGVVRDWLGRSGESNLVGLAEQDFATVDWFACSALGRAPDDSGRAFAPRGALAPFAWVLQHNGVMLPDAPGGPVDRAAVKQALHAGSDHAPAVVLAGRRGRGARRSRAIHRAPLASTESSSKRLIWQAAWGLAVAAVAWGTWSSGVLRTERVGSSSTRANSVLMSLHTIPEPHQPAAHRASGRVPGAHAHHDQLSSARCTNRRDRSPAPKSVHQGQECQTVLVVHGPHAHMPHRVNRS
ncbi:MAG: TRAFAC clade GTPase domain-containing protein [Solirubrobacteraceae bacterium]